MYRVKVHTVGDGQHPSEAVVSVTTAEGKQEELIVDKRSLEHPRQGVITLRVGYPLKSDADRYLIELPRETMRGEWRIWVKQKEVEAA